jgi:thiosulfate/3-mercaptopyruvate sulfurtransferase
VTPVEPWERVWIDAETFAQDIHSYINCTDCHSGQAVDDFEDAHDGMVTEVVTSPEVCGSCHVDSGEPAFASLHNTLAGYDTSLYARSAPEHYGAIEEMQAKHCNSCHASCGDCHVSKPDSVGGGLVNGHVFSPEPSMSQNCTACHGSRVKNEYYGSNEGIPSDVHFRARMDCAECHTGDSMHGMDGNPQTHRYAGAQSPTCESCHPDTINEDSEIEEHAKHEPDNMSCQVCHSTQYINCVNCHVEQTEDGTPFFTVEDNFMGFYIGRNPIKSDERPYDYVPVRHVPIAPDSFSFYGEDLLPNFDALPTWVYATPHNIQRITPQAERCRNCHTNEDIFLTRDVVAEAEQEANEGVIVRRVPRSP